VGIRVALASLICPLVIPPIMGLANLLFRGMPLTAVHAASLADRFREGTIFGIWMTGGGYLMLLVALPIHSRYRERGFTTLSRYVKLGALLGGAVPFLWSLFVVGTASRQPSPVVAMWGLVFFVLAGVLCGVMAAAVFWMIAVRRSTKVAQSDPAGR
jgi:hypothetical protein